MFTMNSKQMSRSIDREDNLSWRKWCSNRRRRTWKTSWFWRGQEGYFQCM